MPPDVAFSKADYQLARMHGYMACHHDQVADNCAYTTAFNIPLLLGCPSSTCALTDHTENVIGNHPQFEYPCIGREFLGWKPLQIHVSFTSL